MSLSRRALLFGRITSSGEPESEAPRGLVSWLADEAAPGGLLTGEGLTGEGLRAKVMPFSCLNHLGGFCATCEERCPVAGAIAFHGRAPRVDPERCDGCGRCVAVCPAPGGAILMAPAAS